MKKLFVIIITSVIITGCANNNNFCKIDAPVCDNKPMSTTTKIFLLLGVWFLITGASALKNLEKSQGENK